MSNPNQIPPASPGTQRLYQRIVDLEHSLSYVVDQLVERDARIAELEQNQKKPRAKP